MTRKKKILKIIFVLLLILAAAGAAAGLVINHIVKSTAEERLMYEVTEDASIDDQTAEELKAIQPDCILILGAGIMDDETPTPMLKDRLDAGIELYKKGVAPKLLLTGDNGQEEHNSACFS